MPITLNGDTGILTPMYNGTISSNAVTPSVNMKSRIINGAMVIDQRNAGASIVGGNNYGVDRFQTIVSQSSKYNVQQNAGSVTPPAGFTNYLGITSTSAYSVISSDYFAIRQFIEGFNIADLAWGTANAKTVTLSFWVRSSLTGTFGGALQNASQTRAYPYSYTISSANTWEYKTITISGDTTGTWLTNNGQGIGLYFSLGTGSASLGTAGAWAASSALAPTGETSVVGTNGATFYITGVQLEVGSTATSFDYRPYGTELALCQRYYKIISRVGSSGGGDQGILNFADWNGVSAYSGNIISPNMRTAPSLSYSALSDFTYYEGGSAKTPTTLRILGSSPTYAEINIEWTGGLTTGRAGWLRMDGASGWLSFSSEL